ncbi:hypothetical protein FA95DRAFT_1684578 [Auriscalpium vulgare]|uniref:Uncharacterized protein n=1 Tax=Auriscalpium vulgare TaxID=40419 RepID=A0ACB8R443_9AGAM|nr:hypothetical protein FA95DRAFT_1684578 [Auriscalpium vulgare]
MLPPQASSEATDIFSLSDQVLGDRLQFIEEIGFGNWGSVWLCRPKNGSLSKDGKGDVKLAVKLVHRSKTTTTAARVRSLWNEMKIVRTFKNDPHPSIVPFHSFIITPSYALITMDFLPTLVPVDVPEPKAKEWFRSLLSGVQFLHTRGVVHNDIKPANILLSYAGVPVLVDFGFAEKYDTKVSRAFHSNLTYGTPEYLSPERARGLPHDTRKSDIWSLGVTFFEILIGRTPFEYEEGEQFTTKEDLEKYWARTMRGKWVGSYTMSKGVERLIHRMVQPNADLRCTATEAMADLYWNAAAATSSLGAHKKAASISSPDASKILDIISPWSTRRLSRDVKVKAKATTKVDKENIMTATKPTKLLNKDKALPPRPGHARAQSLLAAESNLPAKKRATPSGLATLAPIRGSPTTAEHKSRKDKDGGKENSPATEAKRPYGARKPVPRIESSGDMLLGARRGALVDRTNTKAQVQARPNADPKEKKTRMHAEDQENVGVRVADKKERVRGQEKEKEEKRVEKPNNSVQDEGKSMGSVRDRMREWERERERLREMERVKEGETDVEDHQAQPVLARGLEFAHTAEERDNGEETTHDEVYVSLQPADNSLPGTPMSPDMNSFWGDSFPRSVSQSFAPANESGPGLNLLKQSLKMSFDRTVQLYKSSTIGKFGKRSSQSPEHVSRRQSWENEELVKEANSSLPVVRNAVRNAQVGADSRADRMTIWIQNVEKVVEDARQNFASSSVAHLPPLPIAPISRSTSHRTNLRDLSNRSSRLPRKILAASQIFSTDGDGELSPADQSFSFMSSSVLSASQNSTNVNRTRMPEHTLPVIPSEEPTRATMSMESPLRMRRATVMGRSPEKSLSLDIETGSPSRRKEKSKSQNDLQRAITPVSRLTFELERLAQPSPPVRLSAVVDRSIFIAEPSKSKLEVPLTPNIRASRASKEPELTGHDSLTASPFVVQPYPARERAPTSPTVDSPTQRRIEGVYDRFLMATTGVKRLGRGYQSDNVGPVANTAPTKGLPTQAQRMFHSTRRVMPPPVSSEDARMTLSVDELGVMQSSPAAVHSPSTGERTGTVRGVRKALKAIVTGKTAVKKHAWA